MFTPKFIDPLEYAGTIAKALDPGVLLTTRAKGRTNTMTIGWGTIGVEWGARCSWPLCAPTASPTSCWKRAASSR